MVSTVSRLNRVNIVYPEILQLSFFRHWLKHTVYETSVYNILQSNQHNLRAVCIASRPEPPRWRGDMEDGRSGVTEGGWKRGRAEEERRIRRRRKGRKEKSRQGGGRKKGWPFEPGAAFEFQPDFKTIQVSSKISRTFTWSYNVHYNVL